LNAPATLCCRAGHYLIRMRLDRQELKLFETACADQGNFHAQELMNVFGAESASTVLDRMPAAPLEIIADLVGHVWRAIEEQKQR
jgi:hypothetical protein